MKKLFVLFVIFSLYGYHGSFAQMNEEKTARFQLGFFSPLSTNGREARNYTNHVSVNILTGVSENERVFTFGGLGNFIRRNASGFQFAGLWNVIGNEANGFQFSGLANVIGGDAKGFQFAGIGNLSEQRFSGFQFSGIGNIAGDVTGFQFGGVFNVAKNVKGVQFAGLLNVAENSDYPVGLVNLIKNGEKSIGMSYNESGSITASFRSGGRIMYGILGVGYNHKADDEAFVTEGGFGIHIPVVERFRINTELKTQYMTSFSGTHVSLSGLSILPALRIFSGMELFAGPSLNYGETDNVKNSNIFPSRSLWKKEKENRIEKLFLGYTVGIQFIL